MIFQHVNMLRDVNPDMQLQMLYQGDLQIWRCGDLGLSKVKDHDKVLRSIPMVQNIFKL